MLPSVIRRGSSKHTPIQPPAFCSPKGLRMLFQFTTLAHDTIRLFRFLPHSTPKSLYLFFEHQYGYSSQDVQYTAISYCCGDINDRKPITLNGRAFMVPSNLVEALSAILQYHIAGFGGRFWVDAICINRGDVKERNLQVQQMWKIFNSATEVFCWLGPEDQYTAAAFARMRERSSGLTCPRAEERINVTQNSTSQLDSKNLESSPSSGNQMVPSSEGEMTVMTSLLCRDFFQTAWTRAEYLQAREAIFISGKHRCSYITLHHYMTTSDLGQPVGFLPVIEFLDARNNIHKTVYSYAATFSSLVYIYARLKCTDERDRIFALLCDPTMRMLPDHNLLQPDYNLNNIELARVCVKYFARLRDVDTCLEEDERAKTFLHGICRALGLSETDSTFSTIS